jgi:hypothetical protein
MEDTITNLAIAIATVAGSSNPIAIAIGVIAGSLFSLFGGKK